MLCKRASVSIGAMRMLRSLRRTEPDPSPAAFLERLLDAQYDLDIILFVPYLMERRDAVWWGCLCVALVWHEQPTDDVEQAVQAALGWIADQDEESRVNAGQVGKRVGWENAAGALAMSAHWSGGSLAPADQPMQPPPWDMTARAVAGAVCLVSAEGPIRYLLDNYRAFALLGYKVLHGVLKPPAEPAGLTLAELAELARAHLPTDDREESYL